MKTKARIVLVTVSAFVCVLGQSLASAREIHYGAMIDAAVIACDRLHWRGQIEASANCVDERATQRMLEIADASVETVTGVNQRDPVGRLRCALYLCCLAQSLRGQ